MHFNENVTFKFYSLWIVVFEETFGYRKAIEQVVYSSYSFPIKGQLLRFQSPIEDHI